MTISFCFYLIPSATRSNPQHTVSSPIQQTPKSHEPTEKMFSRTFASLVTGAIFIPSTLAGYVLSDDFTKDAFFGNFTPSQKTTQQTASSNTSTTTTPSNQASWLASRITQAPPTWASTTRASQRKAALACVSPRQKHTTRDSSSLT